MGGPVHTLPKNAEEEEKKAIRLQKLKDDEIRDRNGLAIPLLPESPEDILTAKTTEFADQVLEQAKKRQLEINASPIFKIKRSKQKQSIFHRSPKEKALQLSALLAVNTKLKIDPFLKDNDWNGVAESSTKSLPEQAEILIVKKKDKHFTNGINLLKNSSNYDITKIGSVNKGSNGEGIT
ncbi:hypothetical protein G9A89_023819 [Geosiphon pyriformis]|nr:hypothetical protein G9A89_023819 [Geosiphon pyriformis]